MDRKTELRLSLYLDDLLPEEEREEFEARLERDPEIRDAVAFHLQAARILAEDPELPPGFVQRAAARLEGGTVPPGASRWWERFWSLETAGLAAAAALVALILYPVLSPRDSARSPDRQAEPMILSTPEGGTAPSGLEDSKRIEGSRVPETPPGAGRGEPVATEPESPVSKAAPNGVGTGEKSLPPGTGPAPAPGGDTATGLAQAPSTAGKEASPQPSFAAYSKAGARTGDVPFRVLPFPGRADLGERGYLLMRSEQELARVSPAAERDGATAAAEGFHPDGARTLSGPGEGRQETGPAPPDFSTEMALLIPARETSPAPARFEVRRIWKSGSVLFVEIHRVPSPEPEAAGGPSPSFQLLVLPATDLEIRLVKID